ncbi:MAG: hypothetical protein ACK4UN_17010 [Limisphaerales bacterium]
MNNLRQLTMAWKMYAHDNGDRLVQSEPQMFNVAGEPVWVTGDMRNASEAVDTNRILNSPLFQYVKNTAVFRCPADRSNMDGVPRVRSYSMNWWLNGVKPAGSQASYRRYQRYTQITVPDVSRLAVFIDEHEDSLKEGKFFITLGPTGKFAENMPANRRHDYSYTLSFADGHVEAWKLRDPAVRNWKKGDLIPSGQNEDYKKLSQVCTAPQ